MTYGDIYAEFKKASGLDETKIENYRPCCSMFGVPDIPNAILVWLKRGGKIIYIAKEG